MNSRHSSAAASQRPSALASRFARLRAQTEALARPLSPEDCQAQSMPDASPVKWHLAHVTWFFEVFVLERFEAGFKPHNPAFRVLFNSYYNGVGDKHPRPQRGLLTRPSMAEVLAWRAAVDQRVLQLLQRLDEAPPGDALPEILALVELGLNHEQQHQELLLTDVKHLLSLNPSDPIYAPAWPLASVAPVRATWCGFAGGLATLGHTGDAFHFDNESPRHSHFLRPYALLNRLVTHGEWLAFVNDGGYQNPRWWLSAGWDWVNAHAIRAPLYWRQEPDASWTSFTLHGRVPLDDHTPISHISLYEADAYTRWCSATCADFEGARLPTEFEWEAAVAPAAQGAESVAMGGNFLESRALHPMPVARVREGLLQALGDVWEWTRSSYSAYPGYRPWAGAAGEYNGKFMANQYVLRGGSCATPASHIRATYRNFFPAETRWQFTGLRLARDA